MVSGWLGLFSGASEGQLPAVSGGVVRWWVAGFGWVLVGDQWSVADGGLVVW